ncbi:SusC/RagA family TonB-linked outer membrane protein [Aureicoccus marinus]|jgi:TonB-linked SusC/RagA family outer membrane protein|uniref:SusC/RagA family TonB-linked outer membrane protein n=1 Tax=Aureicoccus marinus TaxID=754435 RepID=A0A2S7T3D8_9FLAO|nr:SusC/RagA family TonB-linked outer membrane protein [Aureicoccus marinus]PQJ14419.1 SusC/RagA family TonB-linked outer membrane protein [Aureicoccus marinus]
MRTKLTGLLMLFMALVVQVAFAQKTITGTVTDADGVPLPGANIVVEGTANGTQTDFDGNYSIEASEGQVLLFTYIGLKLERRVVGAANVINVQMFEDAQALQEVVVTAQGIKREKQALGYAVSEVGEEQLEQRPEGDIGRVLTGKASGLNITNQSGLSGSGTSIIIRGLSTFSGSNQPLFIVDGVPFASQTNANDDFVDGNNGSSRFLDLDPNNIESVNVLKGLAAATLYGTQGRNGVILITTKNGSAGAKNKKNEVSVTSSVFFNEIASLADYQSQYGNGFDQNFGWFFSNWGPSFDREGTAGWGAQSAIDDNGTLAHPYSTASSATGIPQAFPEFAGARYDWRPYNSVGRFFRTGTVLSNSVNVSGASDDGKTAYNANFGHLDDSGFTPGNNVQRYNIGVGGRAVLSNKITVAGTLNYSRTRFRTPPVAASTGNGAFGSGSSVFGELFFTPRSVDLIGLPFENPLDGSSVYYRQNNSIQHPLWTVKNAQFRQLTNRTFGQISATYAINDNLNLLYRFGLDVYAESNTNSQNKGGRGQSDVALESGILQTWTNLNTINNHDIILSGQYDLSDKVGMTFNAGATSRREVFDRNGVASSGQQVFGVLRHFNFAIQDEIQFSQERNIAGVFGQIDFDYDRMFYLTLAGRNDWVSNLAPDNRSIFYPSASVSFIPTKFIDGLQSQNGINYLKIRAGYGTSANFPTGYPVAATLNLNTQDFQSNGVDVVTNSSNRQLGNPALKPELLQELEFGVEARAWDNRITLDASYYTRKTEDLIVSRPLDPSTGFATTQTNVGEIQSNGIEIDLGVDIFRPADEGGFAWNVNANWTTNESIVKDLGQDTDVIVFSGFSSLGNAAIKDEQLGVIVGTRVQRNDAGNLSVNADGSYIEEQGLFVIGDPNPDWLLNVNNSISFKNFTLSALISYTHGGDIYSRTVSTLLGRGLTTDTEDRLRTFILPGDGPDGNPNNVQLVNSQFYFSNVLFGPDELGIYDASVLRLQEVSLSYSVPSKILDKTPFGSLSFTLSGQNLWFDAINIPDGTNFDPNVAGVGIGNGRGFDFLNGPSSKRYGMSIKASF